MCLNENHEINRQKVCLNCVWKADRGKATDIEIKTFQEKWLEGYDPENSYMPNGICTTCQVRLHATYNHFPGDPPIMYIGKYEEIKAGKNEKKNTIPYPYTIACRWPPPALAVGQVGGGHPQSKYTNLL